MNNRKSRSKERDFLYPLQSLNQILIAFMDNCRLNTAKVAATTM